MIASIIYVFSIAFQVSGALILLEFLGKDVDKKIRYNTVHENDGIPMWIMDDNGKYTDLDQKDLQRHAELLYKNIVAFAFIVIGYALGIFGDTAGNKWIIFIAVIGTTFISMLLSRCIIRMIVKRKYDKPVRQYEDGSFEKIDQD